MAYYCFIDVDNQKIIKKFQKKCSFSVKKCFIIKKTI